MQRTAAPRQYAVLCNVQGRIRSTTLRELAAILGITPEGLILVPNDAEAPPDIVLDIPTAPGSARTLAGHHLTGIHSTPPHLDAFELLRHRGTLYLFGNTARGLLQAVFQLAEVLAAGESIDDGFRRAGTFRIPQRIFHLRFNHWPCLAGDVRYVAHMGASHVLLSHDWQGNRRLMQGYVTSPVFPDAIDPAEVQASALALRRVIDECADYGLESMIWLTELPCQGGPWVPEPQRQRFLERFPADVLSDSGTYEGAVLCFGHPKVQAFYRDLMGRFFAQFPEIGTIFLFGRDSSGEFCDPGSCPRCRGLSPFEQRDRLIRFLADEGNRVRPGLRVLTTGWEWDRESEEFLRRQDGLPSSSGLYLAAQKDGWQVERQVHEFMQDARRICERRGQVFIGYDNLHWGDDTVHHLRDIQDFPLGVGAKIRRWHDLRVDGIFDHWGGRNEDIPCNSVACRDFMLDPLADPAAIAGRIAFRQFGDDAGPLVLEAWQLLERAHGLLSHACTWTPWQWPAWCECRSKVPEPGNFETSRLPAGQLPPRRSGSTLYNPPGLAPSLEAVSHAWAQAYPFYARAWALLEQALARADDTPLFYRFWWNGSLPTPSRREHIRRQILFVKSIGLTGRDVGLHFGLHALHERSRHEPGSYLRAAPDLLREDLEACRMAAAFFTELSADDGDLQANRKWAEQYRRKAEGIANLIESGLRACAKA